MSSCLGTLGLDRGLAVAAVGLEWPCCQLLGYFPAVYASALVVPRGLGD